MFVLKSFGCVDALAVLSEELYLPFRKAGGGVDVHYYGFYVSVRGVHVRIAIYNSPFCTIAYVAPPDDPNLALLVRLAVRCTWKHSVARARVECRRSGVICYFVEEWKQDVDRIEAENELGEKVAYEIPIKIFKRCLAKVLRRFRENIVEKIVEEVARVEKKELDVEFT